MTVEPQPAPCPVCGRAPRLIRSFTYGQGYSDPSRYWFQYQCRGRFGLRLHLRATATAVAKGEWSQPTIDLAARYWDRAVIRWILAE